MHRNKNVTNGKTVTGGTAPPQPSTPKDVSVNEVDILNKIYDLINQLPEGSAKEEINKASVEASCALIKGFSASKN